MPAPRMGRFVGNTTWLVVGRILRMAANLIVGAKVASHLGADEFGLMCYAVSFATMFGVVATLGIDSILSQELARNPDRSDEFLGTAWAIKAAGAVLGVCAIAAAASITETDARSRTIILVYSATCLFQSLNVLQFYFEARVEAQYAVMADLIQTALVTATRIILLVLAAPMEIFVLALVSESALYAALLVFFYGWRGGRIDNWRVDGKIGWLLLRHAAPLAISTVSIVIYQTIDQIMLKHFLNDRAGGYYGAAVRLCMLASFLPLLLSRALAPALVAGHTAGKKLFEQRIQIFIDLMLWCSIAGALALVIAAPWLVRLLLGSDYLPSIPVLRVVAWKEIFTALGIATGQWVIITRQQRFAPLRTLSGCLSNVGLNLILIPRYGPMGAAIATIFSFSIASFWIHAAIPPYAPLFRYELASLTGGLQRLWRQRHALRTGSLSEL